MTKHRNFRDGSLQCHPEEKRQKHDAILKHSLSKHRPGYVPHPDRMKELAYAKHGKGIGLPSH